MGEASAIGVGARLLGRLPALPNIRLSGALGSIACVVAFIGVTIELAMGDGAAKKGNSWLPAPMAISGSLKAAAGASSVSGQEASEEFEDILRGKSAMVGVASVIGEASAEGVGSRLHVPVWSFLVGASGQTTWVVAFMGVKRGCEVGEDAG
jgi:hypothetical protein